MTNLLPRYFNLGHPVFQQTQIIEAHAKWNKWTKGDKV